MRKALGIPFDGKDLGYTLSVIVRIEDLARYHPLGEAERFLFISPEGTWGNFTTIDGRSLYRFSVVGLDEKIDPADLDIAGMVRRALGRDDVDFELKRVLQWRRSQFTADEYCKGRVFLAGDSAHTMSPTGGHGLNTGVADVMGLSWILQALLEGWGRVGASSKRTTRSADPSLCGTALALPGTTVFGLTGKGETRCSKPARRQTNKGVSWARRWPETCDRNFNPLALR